MGAGKLILLLRSSDIQWPQGGNREGQQLCTLEYFWKVKSVLAANSSRAPQVSAAAPLRGNPLECRKIKQITKLCELSESLVQKVDGEVVLEEVVNDVSKRIDGSR